MLTFCCSLILARRLKITKFFIDSLDMDSAHFVIYSENNPQNPMDTTNGPPIRVFWGGIFSIKIRAHMQLRISHNIHRPTNHQRHLDHKKKGFSPWALPTCHKPVNSFDQGPPFASEKSNDPQNFGHGRT